MTTIEEIKHILARLKLGHFTSSTVHELGALAEKLVHEIEDKTDGDQYQEIAQGAVAQEAGRPAGAEDPRGEAQASVQEQIAVPAKASAVRG